ncbi:MAG TPA: ABC transporter ATP-binding protein [Acidimicrobiia bacterium]
MQRRRGRTAGGLQVDELTVRYGDTLALDHVDLAVARGEIVSVLGPSGSGKSTLLRAVAGLVPDAIGTIRWDGLDISRVPPHRREFGLMFQDHALFPHRDVLGNVVFGLRMQKRPRAEAERRAHDVLALVGMEELAGRRIAELSGGEQQRVALARALAPAPRLLMLDEPLGALDRALRDRLVADLRSLFVALELTIVFVTHDHDEAFALADRVVVVQHGRIARAGTPAEVWEDPGTEAVARFLGWNVTDVFGDGLVAVRPESLRLGTGPVRGTVSGRTFRRDHFLVTVDVGRGDPINVAVPVDGETPEIGAPVALICTESTQLRRDTSTAGPYPEP